MMKKIIYGLMLLMLIFVPRNVFAATEGFNISPENITIYENGTGKITITAYNAIGDVEIISNDSTIVTVDKSFWDTGSVGAGDTKTGTITITGKKIGTATITMKISAALFDKNATDISGTKTINVTVLEKQTPPPVAKYTVTYNGNGGSGAPSAQTKNENTTITLSAVKPTKEGYEFVEWNTKIDGSGTSYQAGGQYDKNANITLYAQWRLTEVAEYTVTYDGNGGSDEPLAQTKNENTTITLSTVKPTKKGYEFVGWNTKADGSGTTYQAGGKYDKNANITLYAQWKLIENVKDNPNTGDTIIYIILILTLGALIYSYWYMKKVQEN